MGSDSGEALLNQLRASLDGQQYSASAIYAGVIVAFGGSAFVLIMIFLLWHPLREVYATQKLLDTHVTAIKTNSIPVLPRLRTCLRVCYEMDEQTMLRTKGLDSVVYVKTLKMLRDMFGIFTLIPFLVACPINIFFNLKQTGASGTLAKKDSLLLLTPTLLSHKPMIAHVVLGWVANTIVFIFVWLTYRGVLRLRTQVMSTSEYNAQHFNRTLMVLNLPKSARTVEGINHSLSAISGTKKPLNITVGRDTSHVRKLLQQYNKNLIKYERLATDNNRKKGTNKVTIQMTTLENDLLQAKRRIELERSSKISATSNYGFATFSQARDICTITKNYPESNANGSIKIQKSSPPEQIIWANMNLTEAQRGSKQVLMNLLYFALVLLWIVPSAFIGCFISNLNRLANVWPAFNIAMASHKVGFAILQGVLAPFITTLVFAALPYIFRKVSFMQGKVTRCDRELEVLRKLYAFFYIDNFFIFTMMGVIWDIIAQIISTTESSMTSLTVGEVWNQLQVGRRIATAIINVSSFWVMYLLRSIFGLYMTAAQPITLLKRLGERLNFIKQPTPRQLARKSTPQPFQYAINYLNILFNATIALAFTTIQPLVLPVAFLLFLLAVPIKKYEIIHIASTKYESYGAFWPLISDTILFSLASGNLILFCVVWVQADWQMACAVAPLVVTVVIFKLVLYFKFDNIFQFPDIPYDDTFDVKISGSTQFLDPVLTMPLEDPILTYNEAMSSLSSSNISFDRYSTVKLTSSIDEEDEKDEKQDFTFTSSPVEPEQAYGFNELNTTARVPSILKNGAFKNHLRLKQQHTEDETRLP